MQVGLLSKVSSTCKLIRMICQILSFQIGSNLVGVSLSKSLTLTFGALAGIYTNYQADSIICENYEIADIFYLVV